ncbi:MAG TPA: TMEM175 family protein [Candidatus Baltobacteraceae bacterium]|nr:TMEM175 family protein [Candidatus Baltobacteraceae bacterium]
MEAFSDIVIGFSLAQIGGNLVAARSFEIVLFLQSSAFLAFVLTFFIVASMWWNHNRLFARYFVPTPVSIVLNFVMLGFLVLFVFSIQVFTKSPGPEGITFYLSMFGCTFLLLGVLYLSGAVARRTRLCAEDFRKGFMRGLRHASLACGMLVALAIMHHIGLHVRTVWYLLLPPALFTAIVSRLAPVLWAPLRKAPKASPFSL